MKQKKMVLALLLALILLLGVAYLLYMKFGASMAPSQLSTRENQASGSAGSGADADAEEAEPIPAPDFTVYDADGNQVHLSDYLGKPVVVNFWASWCGPCQMEMPDFQETYLELGEEVQFLMINMTGGRETLENAQAFIAEQGYTFPVFFDQDADAARTYGAYSLPTTYFIDAEGNAVAQATGAIDRETLQTGIDMIYSPEAPG